MAGPGDDLAQGAAQGMTQFNPITKMLGGVAQGGGGDQIMQLLQALGLMQPPPPQAQPLGNPISGVGPAPIPNQGGLKGRMMGGQ